MQATPNVFSDIIIIYDVISFNIKILIIVFRRSFVTVIIICSKFLSSLISRGFPIIAQLWNLPLKIPTHFENSSHFASVGINFLDAIIFITWKIFEVRRILINKSIDFEWILIHSNRCSRIQTNESRHSFQSLIIEFNISLSNIASQSTLLECTKDEK